MASIPTTLSVYPVSTAAVRQKRVRKGAWRKLFFGKGPLWGRLLYWSQRNITEQF